MEGGAPVACGGLVIDLCAGLAGIYDGRHRADAAACAGYAPCLPVHIAVDRVGWDGPLGEATPDMRGAADADAAVVELVVASDAIGRARRHIQVVALLVVALAQLQLVGQR